MARQRLTYKLYPVSLRVDPRGVYYGVVQGATTEPETSLREILAYKKVTAFDPAQVVRLVEDVIQGGMELTALDGRPRAISSMLKTYLGFDKSFPTADARVTNQQLVSRVRLLKDLRVSVNMDDYTLVNDAETQLPYVINSAVDFAFGAASVNYISASSRDLYYYDPGTGGVTETVSGWLIQMTGRRLDEYSKMRIYDKTSNTMIANESNLPVGNLSPIDSSISRLPFVGFYQSLIFFKLFDGAVTLDSSHDIVLQILNDDRSQVIYEVPLVVRSA